MQRTSLAIIPEPFRPVLRIVEWPCRRCASLQPSCASLTSVCGPQTPLGQTTSNTMLYAAVKNLPKTQAIVGTISGVFALSYVCWAADRYSGKDYGGAAPGEPHTTSAEWQAASVEYAKAQKANPIRHFRE